LVGTVRNSFDSIDEVQAKVVTGVENGTQKLERTRDRNKRKVARDAKRKEADLKMWPQKLSGYFRK